MGRRNMSHECKHEADLGKMAANIESLCSDVSTVKKAVIGNGGKGHDTRIAILEDKAKSMPTPRQLLTWASVGGGFVSGLAFFLKWMITTP